MWSLYTGIWPTQEIDHINGDRGDNRKSNLREVDAFLNHQNSKIRYDNKSGKTGVSFNKAQKKWVVNIGDNGRPVFLGAFANIQDAISAREAAEVSFGYHENHGRETVRYKL